MPGDPAPAPLGPKPSTGSSPPPPPARQLHKNPPPLPRCPLLPSPGGGEGGTRHCPDLPWGPPSLRSVLAYLASLPLSPHLPQLSRPRPRLAQPSGGKPCGRRAASRLWRGSEPRCAVTAPPSGQERERGGGSGALTPPPPSPRANQKIRGSGSNPRSSPGKRSATPRPAARGETPKRRAGSHSGPLRSPRHRALGDAGWGPPEQLCSLLPRFPPEIPPYPSLGAQMEPRFPGSKRDNHTPGGLRCPTPKLKAFVFSVSAIA